MHSSFRVMTASWLIVGSTLLAVSAGADTPGEEQTTKSKLLGAGAELVQSLTPVEQINMYLDGFHFASDNMDEQVEAHHFCAALNEEMHQCAIYDGNDEDARLTGIEYIISKRLFEGLPAEEKRLWHSHHYEVKSGQLIMPGMLGLAEHEMMEKLVSTYGKTWHTWHTNKGDDLPLGIPQLMMGFTEDGQTQARLLQQRDQRMDVSTEKNRQARADIPMPMIAQGANAWQDGSSIQLQAEQVPFESASADTRMKPEQQSAAESTFITPE